MGKLICFSKVSKESILSKLCKLVECEYKIDKGCSGEVVVFDEEGYEHRESIDIVLENFAKYGMIDNVVSEIGLTQEELAYMNLLRKK